jgi:hypothetical protein
MILTFHNSAVNRLIDMSENLVFCGTKIPLTKLSLMLSLELCRFISHDLSSSRVVLAMLVSNNLVGIVDAYNFVGFVNPLTRCSTPAVKQRDFLSHILPWFGAAKCKFFILDTLTC